MDVTFWLGILGSIILVMGSLRPATKRKTAARTQIKNRFFAIGNLCMFVFAYLGYLRGGSIFFVILEILVIISTFLMMFDVDDRIDSIVLGVSGGGLLIRSLYLFDGYATILFIIGLIILGLGYSFDTGTLRRDAALTTGSIFLAIFSYLEPNRIFFGLNAIFAIFSGYYRIRNIQHKSK